MSNSNLCQKIDQFVRYSEGEQTLVVDVAVLRRLTGLALRAASNKGYAGFVGNRGNDLIPIWNMASWFRLEQADLSARQHEVLMGLIEPVNNFASTYVKPPVFRTKAFESARPEVKASVLAVHHWQPKIVDADVIAILHARLVAGDSQYQAAKMAGISDSTAERIRKREGAALWGKLGAAWEETFGKQPIAALKPGYRPMTAPRRTEKDLKNAALLRRVYDILKNERGTSKSKMHQKAANELHLSESQVRKLLGKSSSRFGPETDKAWLATFGAE